MILDGRWGRLLRLAVALSSFGANAQAPGDEQLLSGARAFRESDYARALVDFRVAQKRGADPEVHWYIGAALVKLERYEEAVESFGALAELSPARRDALFDYYRATACYGARLYVCAAALLDAAIDGGGPTVAAQAKELRDRLTPVLTAAPDKGTIDWYHQRATAAEAARSVYLMKAFLSEAVVLGRRRADGYRVTEAEQKLGRLKAPPG